MKMSTGLLVLVTCLTVTGCSRQSKMILGKWESADGRRYYEFRSDGKYEYHGPAPVVSLIGSYRIEKNRLYLTAKMPSYAGQWQDETTVHEFSIEGDVLTLDGVKYKRIKKQEENPAHSRPNKADVGDDLQPRLICSVPVNFEQESLDKPIGDLPVGAEKDSRFV